MRIDSATSSYELWLGQRIALKPDDLEKKHEAMKSGAFPFFRATFYRWVQLWKEHCAGLDAAPPLLAVGDLHVENFGTWRDPEGRLVWGINDFDETSIMPYTIDLVRLATSALLAMEANALKTEPARACQEILNGYLTCLTNGGVPAVLAEHHGWLRGLAFSALREPCRFWEKMSSLPDADVKPPDAVKALEELLPEEGIAYRLANRTAGLGSLGRIRVVAIADWRGGKVAREAKALAPSSYLWATNAADNGVNRYADILTSAVRCRDPFVRASEKWICRRLAPDCARVELAALPTERDERKLFRNMGVETANIHWGSPSVIPHVKSHLETLNPEWLCHAAQKMKDATMADWQAWQQVMS